ncbi:hypothetical protein OG979_34625 [Actinomadura citrea]|uniref:hypothetical protein n=1 Tax=Actinomadura citrea TaxID=46158 RepID=UPI002E287891|nr:hypothetical protein [Actinomadura citrea]
MVAEKLASDAVEVLATAIVNPAAVASSTELHDLVRRWFRLDGQLEAFEAFVANPGDGAWMRDLLRQAVERDAAFARSLSAAVDQARATTPPQSNSVHLYADGARGGTFQVAGRDSHRKVAIDIGGSGFALLAVILAIGIVFAVLALQH